MKKAIDLPPVWLLLFLVILNLQSRLWNPFEFGGSVANTLGWLLVLVGFGLMGWAALQFIRHKTSVVPRNVPKAFIAKGPYRFSRNPIYLADAAVLAGVALLLGSLVGLVLVPVFMRVIAKRFIEGEEAGLAAAFPEDFANFCLKTRRWL